MPPVLRMIKPTTGSPAHDLDAEAAVLSAAIVEDDSRSMVVKLLRPEHFYSEANRRIWEAILALSTVGTAVDLVTVARWLRGHGRLQQIGGSAYLAQIIDATPSLSNIEAHASIIVDAWRRRQLVESCRLAEIEASSGNSLEEALAPLRNLIEISRETPASKLGCWATELGDLCEPPPAQPWLLWDELDNRPAIPLGRAGTLSGAGGTSKTTVCVQLAVAVALGRSWLGFAIRSAGPVALLCAESDQRIMRRQLHRSCNSERLSRDDRDTVASNICVFPLAGRDPSLLARGEHGNLEPTAAYRQILDELERAAASGGFGWSLIVLDPLARFAGPDTEGDTGAATRFVSTVETFCELRGTPTVIVTHHSSKKAREAGGANARGVSALTDGFRFSLELTRIRSDHLVGAYLTCPKLNEAPEPSPRFLVRQDREEIADGWVDIGGTMRLASNAEADELAKAGRLVRGDPEAARAECADRHGQAKINRAQQRRVAILDCLPVEPKYLATGQVEEAMEQHSLARSSDGTGSELRRLVELGLALDLSDGSRGKPRMWCKTHRSAQ